MNLLVLIVPLFLVTSILGSHATAALCKNRRGVCQRYQRECSMSSCCDLPLSPAPQSGKYQLQTSETFSTSVAFCDMEIDGGGWTMIMRRTGSISFDRYYHEYEEGFGDLEEDFWYGLRAMQGITSRRPYTMRLDMFASANDTESASHAFYSSFSVQGDNYTLHLGNFSGSDVNLLDRLIQFNGRHFYAKREKQPWSKDTPCTTQFKGGWWYVNETICTPTDQSPGTMLTARFNLVEWHDLRFEPPMNGRTFEKYEMKIRPSNCRVTKTAETLKN